METHDQLSALARIANQEDLWYSLNIEGQKKPTPRYEHGAAMLGSNLFVIGGNCAGSRYLNDVWIFDVAKLQWIATSLKVLEPAEPNNPSAPPPPHPLPPCAGHSVTPWRDSLLVLGGHVKAKDATFQHMPVRVLDTRAMAWSLLNPSGTSPIPRGGHSATLIGTRLFVFGGEDSLRRVLGDLWVLDLATLAWEQPQATGPAPSPRSTHAATAYRDRYLIIFGGGSMASCFNDVCVLDTETMKWSRPKVLPSPTPGKLPKGDVPSPRAGVAAALYGDTWYMVGGGNGKTGCVEMLALDLSQLEVGIAWDLRHNIPAKSSLSSEGISLHVVEEEAALVAFGGYNGKYHNTIALYRLPTQHRQQQQQQPPQPKTTTSPAPVTSNGSDAHEPTAPAENGRPAPVVTDGPEEPAGAPAIRSAKDFFTAAPSPGQAPPSPVSQAPAPGELSSSLRRMIEERPSGPAPMEPVADMQADRDHEYLLVGTKAKEFAETKLQLEAARREAESAVREAAAAQQAAGHELALMRRQLTQAQTAVAESEKMVDELRAALSAEQSRSMRAEVELGEARVKLAEVAELERELEKLRRQLRETEQKKSGGILGFLSGQ